MKCTLNAIYVAQPAIEKILKIDIPVKEAFAWGKLVKAINEELTQFEDCRKKLVDKYAEKDEEGQNKLLPDKRDEFDKEIRELLAVEVEINVQPLNITKLGDIKMSAIDIMALEPFISPEK